MVGGTPSLTWRNTWTRPSPETKRKQNKVSVMPRYPTKRRITALHFILPTQHKIWKWKRKESLLIKRALRFYHSILFALIWLSIMTEGWAMKEENTSACALWRPLVSSRCAWFPMSITLRAKFVEHVYRSPTEWRSPMKCICFIPFPKQIVLLMKICPHPTPPICSLLPNQPSTFKRPGVH